MDEMWIVVSVVVRWLWRAINEYGEVLDVLLQNTRCNQSNASVSVLDIDPLDSAEDRWTYLEPLFVPTLGREDEPQHSPDDLIDRNKNRPNVCTKKRSSEATPRNSAMMKTSPSSPNPTDLSDEEILERAANILKSKEQQQLEEVQRLYRKYGRTEQTQNHNLGKPKKLSMVEALLVAALCCTRYVVSAECPNGNRWHGDAECSYGVRSMVIATMQHSRLELLWERWRSVSDQPLERVVLTEDHLQGSIYHEHLNGLRKELTHVRDL